MHGHERRLIVVPLPQPSPTHATCPWCQTRFPTIVDLLDHVDTCHVPARPAA
jgi:hypothetical protein